MKISYNFFGKTVGKIWKKDLFKKKITLRQLFRILWGAVRSSIEDIYKPKKWSRTWNEFGSQNRNAHFVVRSESKFFIIIFIDPEQFIAVYQIRIARKLLRYYNIRDRKTPTTDHETWYKNIFFQIKSYYRITIQLYSVCQVKTVHLHTLFFFFNPRNTVNEF